MRSSEKPERNQITRAVDLSSATDPDTATLTQNECDDQSETFYLLKNPANRRHLTHSIQQLRNGKTMKRELTDNEYSITSARPNC